MAYAIDIILVAAVALIAFISARRGFVLTVCELVSSIVAFLVGKITSPYVAEFLYANVVKSKVTDFLTEKYAQAQGAIQTTADSVFSSFDFLPEGILSYLENSGMLNSQNLSESVMQSITTVEDLERNVVYPVLLAILTLLCFAVISFIALIVFRFVAKAVSKLISKIKIVGKLDTALGGVIGLVKGVVYVAIIAVVITVLSFANETIASYAADSYICTLASKLLGF